MGEPVVNVEEQIVVKATGRQMWAQTTKVPLRDDAGKVVGLLSITHDISERRRMEQALRESEERLRQLFEASPDAVVMLDASDARRTILDCNQAACQMNGYERQELIGQPIVMLIADKVEPVERAQHLDRLRAGETRQYEDRHRRKDGSEISVETSTKLIALPGRVLVLRIDRDITERKATEEALRLQAQRLYTAARVARVVTCILDIDQVLPQVVDLIRERFGYSHAAVFLTELDGEWAVLHASSSPADASAAAAGRRLRVGAEGMVGYVAQAATLRHAPDVSADPRFVAAAGAPDTRAAVAIPLKVGESVIGVLDVESPLPSGFAAEDISIHSTMADQISVAIQNARLHGVEKQRAEELEQAYRTLQDNQAMLLASDKMASLGRLTAGIAHEMNTPLAAVRASMVELERLATEYRLSLDDPDVAAEDHREIVKEMLHSIELASNAAERASSFVRSIKSQTRDMSSTQQQRFKAVTVVDDVLLLLRHALRQADCTATFAHPDGIVDLYGSPGRLAQVVTNLVTNAIDASAERGGGPIALSLSPGVDELKLEVTDRGTGIAPEFLQKIFEPMFTTKPFGEGTGLGLAIVHDIVTGDFGGAVRVASEVGEGSTFTVSIPNRKEAPDAA